MMTERKRRSEDGRDMDNNNNSSNQSPQSLTKKRNTAKENDFHALSAEFDETAGMLDLDYIRNFQKEAIWRQMQEYKRDARSAQRHASDLERRQSLWVERMAGVCNLWDKAVRDLDIIINGNESLSSNNSRPDDSLTLSSLESWLELVVPSKLPPDPSQSEGEKDASSSSSVSTQKSLERFNQTVQTILVRLQEKDASHDHHGSAVVDWKAAVDRIYQARATQGQVDELKTRVALLSQRLADKKQILDDKEHELRRALKRMDRNACQTVRTLEGTEGEGGNETPSAANTQAGFSSPAQTQDIQGDGNNKTVSSQHPATGGDAHTSKTENGVFVLLGKRKCTPIYPKDAAAIVSMLDVGPGDNVLEAGTGNGSLTLHLARAVGSAGRVYTVERNPDTSAHAKMLAGRFQRGRLLGSVAFHVGELSEVFSKIDGSNEPSSQNGLVGEPLPVFDAIALDMPAPWTQLPLVAQRLRTDRFCVCYLPNMSQVIDLVRECRPWPLRVEDVLEVQWRSWDVRTTVVRSGNNFSGDPENPDVAMVCRPTHTPAGHTAFLVKLRKCAAPRSDQAAEPEQEPEPEPETPAAN
ncbi:hypothetical protein GGH99_001271 [Coemansia sp. RSA 1285]|nr:hypothetical protein GGH99_001271 [Coemansia sp. RSA 1285]